jgi:hypothetical protein
VAELLNGKPAFLGNSAIMRIDALLCLGGGNLGALLAGHQPAGSATLEAIAIRDMLETADLALAAALETFE